MVRTNRLFGAIASAQVSLEHLARLVVKFLSSLFFLLPEALGNRGGDDQERLDLSKEDLPGPSRAEGEQMAGFHAPWLAVDTAGQLHPAFEHAGGSIVGLHQVDGMLGDLRGSEVHR